MAITRKALLAALAGATLLAGCATGPYYGDNGYGYDQRGYAYGGPAYYGEPGYYVAPSVGLGITYTDRDRRDWRGDHRDRDWRRDGQRDRDWRDRDGDRRDFDGRVPNRGGDLGTGRDPRDDPAFSPG